MMTTVNNKYYAVLLRFAKRRPYEFYHQKKKKKKRWLCEVIDMLINLIGKYFTMYAYIKASHCVLIYNFYLSTISQ